MLKTLPVKAEEHSKALVTANRPVVEIWTLRRPWVRATEMRKWEAGRAVLLQSRVMAPLGEWKAELVFWALSTQSRGSACRAL